MPGAGLDTKGSPPTASADQSSSFWTQKSGLVLRADPFAADAASQFEGPAKACQHSHPESSEGALQLGWRARFVESVEKGYGCGENGWLRGSWGSRPADPTQRLSSDGHCLEIRNEPGARAGKVGIPKRNEFPAPRFSEAHAKGVHGLECANIALFAASSAAGQACCMPHLFGKQVDDEISVPVGGTTEQKSRSFEHFHERGRTQCPVRAGNELRRESS